ncbi:hypothetical protein PENTCL1PPCAC_3368, partial [Pristionchus entomophagus]
IFQQELQRMSSNLTLAEELLSIPTGGPEPGESELTPSEKWANLEDPLEGGSFPTAYELNYTIEEIVTTPRNSTESGDFYHQFVNFLENNEWILWAALAGGVALVACIVIILTCWIYQHRKGVIHEKQMRKHAEGVQRQPSESNLENYKRPNMPPPSRSTTMTRGGFLSTDSSTYDLHFTNIETASDVTGPSKTSLCVILSFVIDISWVTLLISHDL